MPKSRKLAKVVIHMLLRKRKAKTSRQDVGESQDAFLGVCVLFHGKWFLIWEMVSFLGWFSKRNPSGLIGLGKYVLLFKKEGRGVVANISSRAAFIIIDFLPWGRKLRS